MADTGFDSMTRFFLPETLVAPEYLPKRAKQGNAKSAQKKIDEYIDLFPFCAFTEQCRFPTLADVVRHTNVSREFCFRYLSSRLWSRENTDGKFIQFWWDGRVVVANLFLADTDLSIEIERKGSYELVNVYEYFTRRAIEFAANKRNRIRSDILEKVTDFLKQPSNPVNSARLADILRALPDIPKTTLVHQLNMMVCDGILTVEGTGSTRGVCKEFGKDSGTCYQYN